ncbi:MAG: OmpH family outer membrane protein [Candidatus Omnitrophica bacterium]|nr:OmpH family outer membrane protein [Candidatus Omnitrophota bacterium]MBU1932370.1 OmpH family outer membrane protein [Candidatus Omnitrophota bacterium]
MLRKIFTGMALAIFLFSGLAYAQENKVGFVDLSKAFDEYQKTKDFDRELEKKGDAKQGQRENLVKDIRKMREEIELMNEKTREKKEQDIEAKIKALQEFDQDAKAILTKERDDMVRDILKEMNDVIQDYGEKNGFSIILNDRVLLYGNSALDLTDEIIKILNDRYAKK